MKESQLRMMQHSEAKLRLLKLYLDRYLNTLSASKFIEDIYVFDLFCGEGMYENKGKGSPILILETIKEIYFANKIKNKNIGKFHCFFNDIEKSKIDKLAAEIDTQKLYYSEIGNLTLSNSDYRNILPQVCTKINTLKKEKAFVFIDPYGYKDIKFSDLKSLLHSKKSEVLLFLPTQFMFRFENKGTPESLIEFINELMPIEQWPISKTGIDFIESLTEAFRNSFNNEIFVDSFIISRDKNQFFCLFFFTSHIYGFDRMLNAKWKIDEEEGRGWHYQNGPSLFDQFEKKANTYKFEQKLNDFLINERTNGEVYAFTLYNAHLPSHANEILTKWQINGRIIANNADGTTARKSSFYLNYQDYKNFPNKIKLKIK